MTTIFIVSMVASALFDVWMLCRAERLRQERDKYREESMQAWAECLKLQFELADARKFNEVNQ